MLVFFWKTIMEVKLCLGLQLGKIFFKRVIVRYITTLREKRKIRY